MLCLPLVATLWLCLTAAFDVGHRLDLIHSSFAAHGYPATSIKYAQASNWMVDYFGQFADAENAALAGARVAATALRLETDKLGTVAKVEDFWTRLAANTAPMIGEAARINSTGDLLTVAAVSLYAVQSFYSHSDWAALHKRKSCACLPSATWFTESSLAGSGPQPTPVPPTPVPQASGTTAATAAAGTTSTAAATAATTTAAPPATTTAAPPATTSAGPPATTSTAAGTTTTAAATTTAMKRRRKRVVAAVAANEAVVTGVAALGGHCSGANVYSYDRPGWQTAYSAAFLASYQWLALIEWWAAGANPAFIAENKHRQVIVTPDQLLYGDIEDDLTWAYFISSFFDRDEEGAPAKHNGRWKGKWSGDRFGVQVSELKYKKTDTLFKERLSASNGTALTRLAWRLFDAVPADPAVDEPSYKVPGFPDPLPVAPAGMRALLVRTTSVTTAAAQASSEAGRADTPDYYARISVAGQSFVEATQRNFANPEPMWTTVAFVAAGVSSVNVTYQLFDEDGYALSKHEKVAIVNSRTEARFTVDMATAGLSGDLSGVHSNDATAATLTGDQATVQLFVAVVDVNAACTGAEQACHGGLSPAEFCAVERPLVAQPSFDSGAAAMAVVPLLPLLTLTLSLMALLMSPY